MFLDLFWLDSKFLKFGRLNPKTFKQTPGIPAEKANLPDFIVNPKDTYSNLFSVHEEILLYWVETIYGEVNPLYQRKQVVNFDTEF
jgi:hypothetical protein